MKTTKTVQCPQCHHAFPVDVMKLNCLRCGHAWTPTAIQPRMCPACQSQYWDRPRIRPAKVMTLAEAEARVTKVDAAISAHGMVWMEANVLKKGTPEYAKRVRLLGQARSILVAAKAAVKAEPA